MTDYVVGFAFSPDRRQVLLIEKQRPAWQHGLLNGVGGHIEEGETPEAAMAREFREETGLLTQTGDWQKFATVNTEQSKVHVFATRTPCIGDARNTTDEMLVRVYVDELCNVATVPNVKWLVPMAGCADWLLTVDVNERPPYERCA